MASIKIEKNGNGFLASVPGLQGGFAEGDTIDEAIFNCVDVIKLIMEYRKERGESLGFNEFSFNKSTSMTFRRVSHGMRINEDCSCSLNVAIP